MSDLLKDMKIIGNSSFASGDATVVDIKRVYISDKKTLLKYSNNNARDNACDLIAELSDKYLKQKKDNVMYIIQNDMNVKTDLDKENMVQMIMRASQETGVGSEVIASIAKQESHFDQSQVGYNGSGIMQLTSISIEDMFLRPQIYDADLKKLIKEYGSLEKVIQAKHKNSSLQLGRFGEILMKYKSPKKLISAMKKDTQLNLKLGAYLYKAKLAQAKGNELTALRLYNGSSIKEAYARNVMDNITNTRKKIVFNAVV